jgi:hypothetical protein
MWTEANGIWILTQFGLDTFLEHDKTDKSFSFSTTNLIIRFIFDKPFRESWKKMTKLIHFAIILHWEPH